MTRAVLPLFMLFTALLPFVVGEYQTYLLTLTVIWAIMALSMGLVLGYVGQINLGQVAFVAIAAYVSSLLRLKLEWNFWIAAPVALVAVVAIAALVGVITLRLKGPYFILVMLAFAEIVRLILANWHDMTNGPLGLRGIAAPEPLLGISFESKQAFYYLTLVVFAACLVALISLVKSKTGRMLVAVREDEVLAEFIGIPLLRQKVIGLCISALIAGLAGVLLGPFLSILSPSQFTLFASVDMIVMVVVGGVGTLAGPIIGAVFLTYIPEVLAFANHFRPILMGVVLILVTLFAPQGIVGIARSLIAGRTAPPSEDDND
jgi:branched-chain amino acid transport system permease protein